MGSVIFQRHEACASCLCIVLIVFATDNAWTNIGLPPRLEGIEVVGAARFAVDAADSAKRDPVHFFLVVINTSQICHLHAIQA